MTVYYVNPSVPTEIRKYRGSERNVVLPDGVMLTGFLAAADGSSNVWPEGTVIPPSNLPFKNYVEVLTFNVNKVDISYNEIQQSINTVYNTKLSELRTLGQQHKDGGFVYSAVNYPSSSQAVLAYAELAGSSTDITLVDIDGNSSIVLTADIGAFLAALSTLQSLVLAQSLVHFTALKALFDATDLAGLESYDSTTGWPTILTATPSTDPNFASVVPY